MQAIAQKPGGFPVKATQAESFVRILLRDDGSVSTELSRGQVGQDIMGAQRTTLVARAVEENLTKFPEILI